MADHSVTMENTLSTLLSDKKYATMRDVLVTMNPADIAAVFSGVETEKLPLLFYDFMNCFMCITHLNTPS